MIICVELQFFKNRIKKKNSFWSLLFSAQFYLFVIFIRRPKIKLLIITIVNVDYRKYTIYDLACHIYHFFHFSYIVMYSS